MKFLILLISLLIGGPAMAKDKPKEENLDPVYYLALDGNVKAALEKLNSIDPAVLSPVERETRRKYLERFAGGARAAQPTVPGLVGKLIGIYQSYWDLVLLQKLSQREGFEYLFAKLVPVVRRLGGTASEFSEDEYDRVAAFLTLKVRETGYYALIGAVSPHLNFMAWKKETVKPYAVDLGDGEVEKVDVVLMEDFVLLGWAAYATFDKLHVGGWVGDKALHCVASSYDLDGEKFKVSFLTHEARHFADKRRFGRMSSSDLEYRAKLNELILVDKTFPELLRSFVLENRDNPENPHSHGSFRLVSGLSAKLGRTVDLAVLPSLSKERVRVLAKQLLSEDTNRLECERRL